MEHRFDTTIDGQELTLGYTDTGHGATVVFLHALGWSSEDSQVTRIPAFRAARWCATEPVVPPYAARVADGGVGSSASDRVGGRLESVVVIEQRPASHVTDAELAKVARGSSWSTSICDR